MHSPLTDVANQWLARKGTTVLFLALRQMPEGLVYMSTEVDGDLWDLASSQVIGPVIVDTLKHAEEGRVKRL